MLMLFYSLNFYQNLKKFSSSILNLPYSIIMKMKFDYHDFQNFYKSLFFNLESKKILTIDLYLNKKKAPQEALF